MPTQSTPTAPPPAQPDIEHVIEISAFTIDRPIVGHDVGKAMNQGIKHELEESLADLPPWVTERVHEFTEELYPLAKTAAKDSLGVEAASSPYVANALQETPEAASQRFQDFYGLLEQDLRQGRIALPGSDLVTSSEGESHQETSMPGQIASETGIRATLEIVERAVCSLFYDRQVLAEAMVSDPDLVVPQTLPSIYVG